MKLYHKPTGYEIELPDGDFELRATTVVSPDRWQDVTGECSTWLETKPETAHYEPLCITINGSILTDKNYRLRKIELPIFEEIRDWDSLKLSKTQAAFIVERKVSS